TRRATFLLGPPASGKTTWLAGHQANYGNRLLIDPDEVKHRLPEYDALIAAGDPMAGTLVQRESSLLQDQIRDAAVSDGLACVHDPAGGHPDYLADIEAIKRQGYRTEVVGTFVSDVRELFERAHQRGLATGRYVPEHVIVDKDAEAAYNAFKL